jgi:hypothetical protein
MKWVVSFSISSRFAPRRRLRPSVTTQDFASETTGGSGCDQRTLKLAINKEVGYEQCGVLVPNSYFGGGHGNITMWASEVRSPRFEV